jgi:hypothetical protein
LLAFKLEMELKLKLMMMVTRSVQDVSQLSGQVVAITVSS